ncbi:hypothetical protein BDD12DRAFT_861181 [Trichophaea hybrida]|nr:hypothetical protein BDD12DRAFT_861181 [Trichophaea hybrida]
MIPSHVYYKDQTVLRWWVSLAMSSACSATPVVSHVGIFILTHFFFAHICQYLYLVEIYLQKGKSNVRKKTSLAASIYQKTMPYGCSPHFYVVYNDINAEAKLRVNAFFFGGTKTWTNLMLHKEQNENRLCY